jgi:hypothetical protein
MLKVLLAIVIAGVLGSLSDWFFMGVLFHDAYNRHPEVWRDEVREGESRSAIIWSSVVGLVMSAAVIVFCVIMGASRVSAGLLVAALMWIPAAGVVLTNSFFVKLDPKITLAHCVGYGVRLALAGGVAGLMFGRLASLAP